MSSAASPGPSISSSSAVLTSSSAVPTSGSAVPTSSSAVLICDLDGTLLRSNSFPRWVRYLLCGSFPGLPPVQRATLCARVAAELALRKAGFMQHAVFKRSLQRQFQSALASSDTDLVLHSLVEHLAFELRPNVLGVLELVRRGQVDAVLATAAAEEYALPLGRRLGFQHVLATGGHGGVWRENSREAKRDRTLEWLEARGKSAQRYVFLTDHEEDLPLMRVSQSVLWFGAPMELAGVRQAAPGIDIFDCRDAARETVTQLALTALGHDATSTAGA